jgi:hypothetical protein
MVIIHTHRPNRGNLIGFRRGGQLTKSGIGLARDIGDELNAVYQLVRGKCELSSPEAGEHKGGEDY